MLTTFNKTKVNKNVYLQPLNLSLHFLFSLSLTPPQSLFIDLSFLLLSIHVSITLFLPFFFPTHPKFPISLFLSPLSSWCLLSSLWKIFIKMLYKKNILILSIWSRQMPMLLHIAWNTQIYSPHVVYHCFPFTSHYSLAPTLPWYRNCFH